jgi:hypothetical protein
MSIFKLPIFYTHYAMLSVEADTLETAIAKFDIGDYSEEQIDHEAFQHPDSVWELDSDGLDEAVDGDDDGENDGGN